MQIPILSGIYTDSGSPEFRTAYPRNLVPVPKDQGVSKGYLRPADGIEQTGTGHGADRGGINWRGVMYRVSGSKLVKVLADGSVVVCGDVGTGGPVTMDYSFDRLAVASGGRLYYWDGVTLAQVTDPDLGTVKDMRWIAGYFLTTDGENLITTDLNDPPSVNPLHYGSSEADPDPVMAVDELNNEAYALNRFTIEPFQNIGGTGFPFQRIEGAQVGRGIIGTQAYCCLGDTFMFLGSGRGESPAVYQMAPGSSQKVSTREVDTILQDYTEADLSGVVMEVRTDKHHQHVLIHLPDQTLVFDTTGSIAAQQPLWHTLTSSVTGLGQYQARGLVWCYDQWNVGDPTSSKLGKLVSTVSGHYGATVGWDFGVLILYNAGNGGIVHELELVCLTGRVALGADPVIWTSYTLTGADWSQERAVSAGKQGNLSKRIAWRGQGPMRHWRAQRFRGTSEAHLSIARLEAQIEPLFQKAASYAA